MEQFGCARTSFLVCIGTLIVLPRVGVCFVFSFFLLIGVVVAGVVAAAVPGRSELGA